MVGKEITPFREQVVPRLIEKLGDNKTLVRQANAKVAFVCRCS
jgi:hypothetical protein